MIFSSVAFGIFFVVVVLLLISSKNQRYRRFVLLGASYFFYGYWDYRFLALIIISTIIDYNVGYHIENSTNEQRRKIYLAISIIANLSLLGFFKYYNFFVDSANYCFGQLGFNLKNLGIILPVGISFYTFQTMSYSIDIYRKKLKPSDTFIDFAIFVAFFPQLIAGPIVRAVEFMPQIKKDIVMTRAHFISGMQIFIFGLIKKLLIADRIAFFVDSVYENTSLYSTGTIWIAVIGYSLQIYCDFSGYSDMAIGLAKVMGFNLPQNFNRPYLSLSITEFWRRWHITLGSWFKDYVYIPLGGNRKGSIKTLRNLIIVWSVTGLWHGSSWNFVIWGLWHGFAIMIERTLLKGIYQSENKLLQPFRWLFTYIYVCLGWVFFRLTNLSEAIYTIKRLFIIENTGIVWNYSYFFGIVIIFIIATLLMENYLRKPYLILDMSYFVNIFIIIFICMGIFFLAPTNPAPFIYFQF